MAEKENKIVLERTYNVPLRKEFQKAPKYKRAKKATTALRQFLSKHMKSDTIKIGRHLNMKIWEKGIKNPPHHVSLTAKKKEDGTVEAELMGVKEKPAKETKKLKKDAPAKKTPQKSAPEPATTPAKTGSDTKV